MKRPKEAIAKAYAKGRRPLKLRIKGRALDLASAKSRAKSKTRIK